VSARSSASAGDHRLAGRQCDSPRRSDPDPQPGEAARTDRDRDAVELGECEPGVLHDTRDQRHQLLGVAALQRQALAVDDFVGDRIKNRGRTGRQRRIDREHMHCGPLLADRPRQ
jgi:hypothetical protein